MSTTRSYLAFLPQHTPSEHSVLAVVDRGDGPEVEVLISLTNAPSATMLAAALNGILLQQVTAERRLSAVLEGASGPVRKAIQDVLPILVAAREDLLRWIR